MAINSLSSSSHGLSGLMSGMDTQAMVDAMLKGTQTKIDTAQAKKTQLTYKQDMYRSIGLKLNALKDSFFSPAKGGPTNLFSTDFFRTMQAAITSNAFRVTADSTASTGNTKVDYIKQLAKASSKKSTQAAASPLEGDFSQAALDRLKASIKTNMTFKVGDTTVEIADLNALVAGKGNNDAAKLLTDEVNRQLNLAGSTDKLNVTFENGKMNFTAMDSAGAALELTIGGGGTKIFTSTAGDVTSAAGKISQKTDLDQLQPKLTVTLNNVAKMIAFDYNSTSASDIAASLQVSMDKAFGPEVVVTEAGGKISFKTKSASSELMLQGSADTMKMLGIQTGQSTKINTKMYLKDINFATPLYGNNFKFNINGVDFNVTGDRTLHDIINEVNSSTANVNISYSRSDDKFVIESKIAGEGVGITMSQSEGNLLSALFGKDAVSGSGATKGDELYKHTGLDGSFNADSFLMVPDPENPNDPTKAKAFTGGSIFLTINGTQYGFSMPTLVEKDVNGTPILDADGKEIPKAYDATTLAGELNKQLKEQFGENDNGDANIAFTVGGTAAAPTLSLKSERGYVVAFANEASAKMLGFNHGDITTTVATGSTLLSELGLDSTFGMTFVIDGNTYTLPAGSTTVDELKNNINNTLRAIETQMSKPVGSLGEMEFEGDPPRYRLFGVDIPMQILVSGKNSEQLIGGGDISMGDGQMSTDPTKFINTEGQNAVLSVNGVEIERNSNNFTIDGLSFELLATTQKKDANGNPIADQYDSADINVTRDTEKIYDGIAKFVEEYNKVVDSINELLEAETTYKEYPPLTAQQKAAMSESEVKLWEESAKEGLLRADPTLDKILADMRSLLYQKPAGSDFALYNIGVKTYYSYGESKTGKLELSNSGADLKKAIAENSDEIAKLFAGADGIGEKMSKTIDAAASTSMGSPGKLVSIAGAKGSAYNTQSSIYKQIKELNDSLASLERKYTSEYNRYWKQFNAMEQMISNMNNQSSWLTQQMGG